MLTVDSGAAETVINNRMAIPVEIEKSDKVGREDEVANGERIVNEGQKVLKGITDNWEERSVVAQVAEVNQGLMSVKRICSAGDIVVFDDDRSYIWNKATGNITEVNEARGVYELRLWVKKGF